MRKTAFNLISVIGGEVLLRGANFVAVVVMARLYGAGTLGLYATTLAYATVAVMIAENGLQMSSIAEIGRSRGDINAVVSRICTLRIVLFALMSALLAAVGWWRHWSAEIWTVGLLVTIRVLLYSYSQLQFSVLKSLDRMTVIGKIQVCTSAVLLTGIVATYLYSWDLTRLLWCFIVSQTIEIGLSLRLLWNSGIRPVKFHPSDWWQLLQRSTPVGITYVMAGMMMRTDVIVLAAIGSRADVGYFAAAHMGVVLFYSTAWLFGSVLLPDLTRLLGNPMQFERYVSRWAKLLLLTAGSGALALSWVAPAMMLWLYGKDFLIAGKLASVLVLAIPFILLNALYFSRAIALDAAGVYLTTYAMTTVLAIVLDLSMARAYGAMGVAVAIVLRELVMFLIFRFRAAPGSSDHQYTKPLSACEPVETLDI